MIKKVLLASVLSCLLLISHSQINWPAINPTTKPWTRWWWLGSAVNSKDLTQNMESYAAVGLGGLEITPIYGVGGFEDQFVDYLSPQWMNLLTHTLKEAKRLNMRIDMATGSGWPFGGGPLIGATEACKDFQYKTYSLKAGEQLKEAVIFTQEPSIRKVGNTLNCPGCKEAAQLNDVSKLNEPVFNNKNLQALALDQVKFKKELPLQVLMAYNENGQSIDLTSKVDANRKLIWTAPSGNWTLYAIFMGWHGKMVERAAPGAEGDVIDHFSKSALVKYLSRFDKAFTGKDISYLRGFFNDSYEVDDARGQSNYTPALFDEFKIRRRYDLRQHLPELLSQHPDEKSLRVLYDYRQTIADLLLEKFTIPWQQWAKAKGKIVRNQSHGSPANILDLYGAVDIPETEGTELLRFKFAASAAHVLGKPLTSAEAATWLNEHFKSSLGDVKKAVDKYFLGGVNHIVYHGTSYSPPGEPWPGWLFYAAVHFQPVNPLWREFGTLNEYVARCQSFLQSGNPDNDVLLYFPFSDHNSEPATVRGLLHHYDGMEGFENTDFKKVAEELTEKGYAWDLISDKQIQQVTNAGGLLKAPGGTYKTIILANTKYLPAATLQKLKMLIQQGAKVIIYKNLPVGAPGMGGLNTKQDAMTGVLKGEDLVELLTRAKVDREHMYDKGLPCVRRSINGGKYYFITNTGDNTFSDWAPLSIKATAVAIFDPMQQRSGIAKTRVTNGVTEVLIQLQPGESCVLQTSTTDIKGYAFPYYNANGNAILITGSWDLKFVTGGPTLPAATTITELGSWTNLPDTAARIFSGIAQYTVHFPKPSATADAYLLNLGKVYHSAMLRLNGRPSSFLIGPTYQVILPANWFTSDNELIIEVANGMANRIADMDKRGVEWKKFYNVNFPPRLPANRSSNGLFTAANWEPETSGLTGPVTLTPLSLMP
jgi:hypothetical protein